MIETKVYIEQDYAKNSYRIWVIRHETDYQVYINIINGELIETKVPRCSVVSDLLPFMELPRMFGDLYFKAIIDYNNQRGVNSENENLLKGKLQATELHLTDMRKITDKLMDELIRPNDNIKA